MYSYVRFSFEPFLALLLLISNTMFRTETFAGTDVRGIHFKHIAYHDIYLFISLFHDCLVQ